MPWTDRAITPNYLPFNESNRTYDPGIVVETQPVDVLGDCPIWGIAPLTKIARRELPLVVSEAWHVRRIGTVDPFASVIKLHPHRLGGRILSRRPEQASIAQTELCLVLLPDLVLTVHGANVRRAYYLLADIIAGTRRRPRKRARPATGPKDDLAAISLLAP